MSTYATALANRWGASSNSSRFISGGGISDVFNKAVGWAKENPVIAIVIGIIIVGAIVLFIASMVGGISLFGMDILKSSPKSTYSSLLGPKKLLHGGGAAGYRPDPKTLLAQSLRQ